MEKCLAELTRESESGSDRWWWFPLTIVSTPGVTGNEWLLIDGIFFIFTDCAFFGLNLIQIHCLFSNEANQTLSFFK